MMQGLVRQIGPAKSETPFVSPETVYHRGATMNPMVDPFKTKNVILKNNMIVGEKIGRVKRYRLNGGQKPGAGPVGGPPGTSAGIGGGPDLMMDEEVDESQVHESPGTGMTELVRPDDRTDKVPKKKSAMRAMPQDFEKGSSSSKRTKFDMTGVPKKERMEKVPIEDRVRGINVDPQSGVSKSYKEVLSGGYRKKQPKDEPSYGLMGNSVLNRPGLKQVKFKEPKKSKPPLKPSDVPGFGNIVENKKIISKTKKSKK